MTDVVLCLADSGQIELTTADYFTALATSTAQQPPEENIYEKLTNDKTLVQVAALEVYVRDRDNVPNGFLAEYKVSSKLQYNQYIMLSMSTFVKVQLCPDWFSKVQRKYL